VFQERIPAHLKKKTHLVQADISNLPFRDFIFHRVLSNSVYQHVPGFFNEPHHILEVARMLCDDGVFVLSIYNYSPIRAFLARLIPAVSYGVGYEKEGFHSGKIYFRRYEWKELEEILEAAFEIKYLKGIQNVPKLITKIFGNFAIALDSIVQRLFISRYTGYHLIASGRKRVIMETNNN
jgi:SAM-dependent methyltransferase